MQTGSLSSEQVQACANLPASTTEVRPWAVVLAAGFGTRMVAATGRPKQFLEYDGAPLYWRSALTFSRVSRVSGLVFVFPAHCLEEEKQRLCQLDAGSTLGLPWLAVAGGELRQDSVNNALAVLPPPCRHVLVHDAARPFASTALINRVCDALSKGAPGVIPGVAVNDTIKIVTGGTVAQTLDRSTLSAVQTPQGFALTPLREAHTRAKAEGWTVTDDAALLERCGTPVRVVEGEAANAKLTTPEDLRMLESPQNFPLPCSGFGYDVHRFGPGRPLKLGGVLMPGSMEVVAHSDGDVLLHALMDAILGCACAGDIGQHFPDTSAVFDNADSAVLLDDVLRITAEAGVRLVQVDLTIITQKPKISPQRGSIQTNVARLLSLPQNRVNVKATTEEGLGFTGAGQGIKAVAMVTGLRC